MSALPHLTGYEADLFRIRAEIEAEGDLMLAMGGCRRSMLAAARADMREQLTSRTNVFATGRALVFNFIGAHEIVPAYQGFIQLDTFAPGQDERVQLDRVMSALEQLALHRLDEDDFECMIVGLVRMIDHSPDLGTDRRWEFGLGENKVRLDPDADGLIR